MLLVEYIVEVLVILLFTSFFYCSFGGYTFLEHILNNGHFVFFNTILGIL
jgi:hypothetical protein